MSISDSHHTQPLSSRRADHWGRNDRREERVNRQGELQAVPKRWKAGMEPGWSAAVCQNMENEGTVKFPTTPQGAFVRAESTFRKWVKVGSPEHPPARGRYHLYVSRACPWAHRTLLLRALKGLDDVITVDVVHWLLTDKGWHFDETGEGCTKDTVFGGKFLREVYERSEPGGTFRVTVPVLLDKETGTIVNNESSEIIQMLNSEFNDFCATEEQRKINLNPAHLQEEMDQVNSWIYPMLNNGVYRAGFARSQEAYDQAVVEVFSALRQMEERLTNQRFLCGDVITLADVRAWTTLLRFDHVYHGHFKCNQYRLTDYPAVHGYARDIYQLPGVAETVNMAHITRHYYQSHKTVNPTGIVPIGPATGDFSAPHDRAALNGNKSPFYVES